jgi:hypothetical protein
MYYLENDANTKTASDVAVIVGSALVIAGSGGSGLTSLGQFAANFELFSAYTALSAQIVDIAQTEDEDLLSLRDGLNVAAGISGMAALGTRGIMYYRGNPQGLKVAAVTARAQSGTSLADDVLKFNRGITALTEMTPGALIKLADGDLTTLNTLATYISQARISLLARGAVGLDEVGTLIFLKKLQFVEWLYSNARVVLSLPFKIEFSAMPVARQLAFIQDAEQFTPSH